MVAIAHPTTIRIAAGATHAPRALAVVRPLEGRRVGPAPDVAPLRLVHGGAVDEAASLDSTVRGAVERLRGVVERIAAQTSLPILFGVLALVAAVAGVRAVQGTPPVTGLGAAPVAEVVPLDASIGEWALVVESGATLWDLAAEIAPEGDRRAVVAALAERNGGSSLDAGQTLVVPAGLASDRG